MVEDFKSYVLLRVRPADVWRDYFPEWEAGRNVRCVFHDDTKPSLALSEDGKGFCHGCGWKCSSVLGFVCDHDGLKFKRGLKRLRARHMDDTVPAREWDAWHRKLLADEGLLDELKRVRGIGVEAVKRYRLGWHRKRLTIPVFDDWDGCVNVRCHDALRRLPAGAVKMVSYKSPDGRKFGGARLYPAESLDAKHAKVYLFEGELNTLLALALGLNAVCVTSGARVWKDEFAERFAGRKVVVCQDVNDPDNSGQEGAKKKCEALAPVAVWVKNVRLPIEDRGGDLIDYVVKHGHTLNDFLELENSTPYFKAPGSADKDSGSPKKTAKGGYDDAEEVSLKEAAHPENFAKPVKLQCLVASMDLAPYVPPKRVNVKCLEFAKHQAAGKIPPKCGACWLPEAGLEKIVEFKPEQRELIAVLEKNDQRVDQGVRRMAEVPAECEVEFKVLEVHNVHTVGVIPDVPKERAATKHDYVMRTGFYFGKHMEANKSYEFKGFSMSHPDTQQVTHVFVEARNTLSAVERFKLSKERAAELADLFQAKGDPLEKMMEIYKDFADTVTRIVRRPLLHAAVDLVWHSPLQFSFNGEHLNKGWLEAIVFGDTRCGKGYVAEGLARHYGLGEVVSGENCSVAGLVGGLETLGRRMVLRWGAIPLNDRGLVIIDEMGALAEEIFGRLSRVRSEGVAEVTKIGHHQRTFARTRLLWLCNPLQGVMADYTYGVQALQGIVGKAEDIARFDYAFAVADGEVAPGLINTARGEARESKFTAAACRDLVHWAWSRKPSQVQFTEKATKAILGTHSRTLAAKYAPTIPLVQGQNIRVKLAKVAAAVAARVFSHAPGNPEVLRVDGRCADAAAMLLDLFYMMPSMSYDSYSRKAAAETVLGDDRELRELFEKRLRPRQSLMLVRCLLSRRLSLRAVAAAASMDRLEAEQAVVDPMLRANAVREQANGYFQLRNPFKNWLEKKEAELERKMEGAG